MDKGLGHHRPLEGMVRAKTRKSGIHEPWKSSYEPMPGKRALKLNIKCKGVVGASTRRSRLVRRRSLDMSKRGWLADCPSDKGSQHAEALFLTSSRSRRVLDPNKRLYFQPPLKLSFNMGL